LLRYNARRALTPLPGSLAGVLVPLSESILKVIDEFLRLHVRGSLVKGAPHPHPPVQYPRRVTPPPSLKVRIEIATDEIQSASRVRVGTRSIDLRAWKPFPVTASDKGAGRSHKPRAGHVILEVAVENSWPCRTGGPSGRDDLSKSRRDLLAVPQSMRSPAGQAAHHRAMKRYVQPIKMAPHDHAGLIGKAQAPHI
jgi:hypothetical protein